MSVAKVQSAIESEEILLARRMTIEHLGADIFELSDDQFGMMLAGVMYRLGSEDTGAGWAGVRRYMQWLDRSWDPGRSLPERPSGS